MKILAVFVLAVLGWSLTEGRLVSKCELRDQLKNVTGNLTVKAKPSGLTVDDLVAKLVCHAEQGSGFNTSTVTQLIWKEGDDSGEQAEDLHPNNSEEDDNDSEEHEEQNEDHHRSSKDDDDDSEEDGEKTNQHHVRGRRHDKGPSSQTRPTPQTSPAQNCTLYGIFQLSSCQVCNDGVTLTANVCGIPCSDLLDDNTNDDISCLLNILSSDGDQIGAQYWEKLEGVFGSISEEKCEDTRASVYFAGCPSA